MLWLNIYSGSQDWGLIPGSEISWRLLNIQKPPPELQEAGEHFWEYHCSFALFWFALNSDCEPLPKMGTQKLASIPQNCSLFFFFHNYWQKKDNPTSYFLRELWIFTYTHLILCLSYLYQKLIICFLAWWWWACSFGVCLFLLEVVTT